MAYLYYKAINWDETEDEFDAVIWEQLTNNFWLDIRVPIAEDQAAWAALPQATQTTIGRAIASASLFSAYQSERCAPALRAGRRTQQEEAVLNIATFMESVHTKGYTTIYRGLINDQQAAEFYAWADADQAMQTAISALDRAISSAKTPVRQAAFILGETQLLYAKLQPVLAATTLPNVSRMLTNILSGSLIFINYIGYKWQQNMAELSTAEQAEIRAEIQALMATLADCEQAWVQALQPQVPEALLAMSTFGANQASRLFDLPLVAQPQGLAMMTLIDEIDQRVLTQTPQTQIVDVDATEAMQESDYDF